MFDVLVMVVIPCTYTILADFKLHGIPKAIAQRCRAKCFWGVRTETGRLTQVIDPGSRPVENGVFDGKQ